MLLKQLDQFLGVVNGWNNTNVTVNYACTDAGSGIASCPQPQVVSNEGANQVVSGTATDKAGNTASASVTLNIDKTPPTITLTSPLNGSTVSNPIISITATVSDNLSADSARENPFRMACLGVFL